MPSEPLDLRAMERDAEDVLDVNPEARMAGAVRRLIAAYREARDAARTVLKAFDDGVFVRDVSYDGESSWAIRLVRPLAALSKLASLDAQVRDE